MSLLVFGKYESGKLTDARVICPVCGKTYNIDDVDDAGMCRGCVSMLNQATRRLK